MYVDIQQTLKWTNSQTRITYFDWKNQPKEFQNFLYHQNHIKNSPMNVHKSLSLSASALNPVSRVKLQFRFLFNFFLQLEVLFATIFHFLMQLFAIKLIYIPFFHKKKVKIK